MKIYNHTQVFGKSGVMKVRNQLEVECFVLIEELTT